MRAPFFAAVLLILAPTSTGLSQDFKQALLRAGDNASEIQAALERVPADQKPGMEFLVAHMPTRDLTTLKSNFLLENVDLAYRTRAAASWKIPDDVFFNNVLPYASINEDRDDFRQQFRDRFTPLVATAKSISEAAALLNNKIFTQLNVKYSRQRRRADQGPFESIETGLASCTGLSVLLIDACRSVGIPARFVGTPLWSDRSGNHSWVEIWDNGWHFTGAAEPTGMKLNQGWFIGRSSRAKRDDPKHAIYAVSYKHTPTKFPLVWDRSIDYVHAVNVTDRYANKAEDLPPDYLQAMFKTYGIGGQRCCVPLTIKDQEGNVVFEGETKDERFDGNDHTTVPLPAGQQFAITINGKEQQITTDNDTSRSQLFAFAIAPDVATSTAPLDALRNFLATPDADWDAIPNQSFATAALTKSDTSTATQILLDARKAQLLQERNADHQQCALKLNGKTMPFHFEIFGEKPKGGRSLYISMHGGGNAPKRVNDRQWNNQKQLYEPKEGVYVAPRAPTDTWNLWHESHIMPFFDRLIEHMVLFEDVNPNRVYVLGYSAGGDGAYQLGPRMADRWAAAAMMAGHPNDAQPDNLSNIGFAIFMGGKDAAYKRNQVAAEWGKKLDTLAAQYPDRYRHQVTIYPEKGHWMDGEDASALPWMSEFTRNPLPKQIIWRKDGNAQPRFYWLGNDANGWTAGERVTAEITGQSIELEVNNGQAKSLCVYLNDQLANLDKPLSVKWPDGVREHRPVRSVSAIHESLTQRFDPSCIFTSVIGQ